MELANKTITITGADSGIGAAVASLFASEGADVVLGARRATELQTIVEGIKGAGGARHFSRVTLKLRDYGARNSKSRCKAGFHKGGFHPRGQTRATSLPHARP
ncbi:SDR family NAD(P)-dependent oxidoreductase [Bradyrhizobium sp. 143]|nr:SDR family NAD(P)-dependent oxidoreductase [Bradyrhizobium sp. 143]MCK1724582.1 SDR family NAD(P)-dependent oxidoreductase [Bradyrhizobium sp. 142]